jgi:DNA helicase II / ATP-dependent DNA helicase PcrA
MKLPPDDDLSPEQKAVCFAPTKETILVSGPPGSGKTVVALFRQKALKNRKKDVQTLVFNHVLRTYTEMGLTFYQWLFKWWRSCGGGSFPYVFVESQKIYDFSEATKLAMTTLKAKISDRGHWGHLILDEAQDFDKAAHGLLAAVKQVCLSGNAESPPSMTILADENQRINQSNSTIGEIEKAHSLGREQLYTLKKNYRNTRQIAMLAGEFYTGLRTGLPDLPKKNGDKPKLIHTEQINDVVDRIESHVKLYENEEIGILVNYRKTRNKLYNRLEGRLSRIGMRLQMYDWKDGAEGANNLVFDDGGCVTVLCYASAKGLEFDTVFLPELQTLKIAEGNELVSKMNLYVMASRAREKLFLMISDPDQISPVWEILPFESDLFDVE